MNDLRAGLRSINRSKGLALGVVLSMGLGLGAAASFYSLADFFVFRPLRVPETDRVVRMTNSTAARSIGQFSYPEYQDYVARNRSFSAIATYETPLVALALNRADAPRVAMAMPVSGNFFSMLRVNPAVGRGFRPEEDSVPARDSVAVISHTLWQRDFAGSPDIIGREAVINGHVFTIIGVTPEDFHGVEQYVQPEIYFPRMMIQQVLQTRGEAAALMDRSRRSAQLLARLKPGVTVAQAKQDIEQIASRLEQEYPETNKGTKASVLTQFAYRLADDPRLLRMAVTFLTIGFLVLGIACVNVSNLLLSTVPARTREMAVRIAMGAPHTRLLRQLLLESAILSGGGSLIGVVIASWFASFVSSIRLYGSELSIGFHPQVDNRVVIFTLAAGFASSLISGLIPAWRCSRSDLNSLLKVSDPRNRPHKTWGREILVGAQVAVASLLLVLVAFLLEDLKIASAGNPGFRVDHILTMSFNPSMAGYDVEKSRAFYTELIQRLRGLPGIKSAAIGQDKPFGLFYNSTNLTIEGYELPFGRQSVDIRSAFVGNGYFETLDIPILRGRAFDRRDGLKAPRTIIVNETMAQQFWPNRDPIGSHLEIKGNDGGPAEVVGIARDSKYGGMDEKPMPFLYRSYDQGSVTEAALFVETAGSPEIQTSAVRTELRNIAPNMPVFDVRTMRDQVHENGLGEPRMAAEILGPFGTVAVVLGVLGLYGVIAYSVGLRTYEIGIRMAVGASNRQILRMVLLKGLRSSAIASSLGIFLSLALLRGTAANMAQNVNPNDPTIYIGVFFLMLATTGVACYIPARHASLVDPNVTLRS
jgi:predicted permease